MSLRTAFHSCKNILSEKDIFRSQEVLLNPKDKLARVVANYLVYLQVASLARIPASSCLTCWW